jgi:pyruvate formate lyase activating enzyme
MRVCIFDIKRFAIHDGPGIRVTVFFKGCPLSCWWCHNPEGIPKEPSQQSQMIQFDGIQIERDLEIGKWVEVEEMVSEIIRDRVYMEETGGGVTFSGGEPLMQAASLSRMLEIFNSKGIHTAVDTSGYATAKVMQDICSKTDLVLFDLKSMDDAKHIKYTGVSNKRILSNLEISLQSKTKTIVRIPLVPGFNDREEEIRAMLDFLTGFEALEQVDILPYHRYANNKYKRIQVQNRMESFKVPSYSQVEDVRRTFESAGFNVMTGG